MTPDSQFFTGAVGLSMFKINWNSRKQAQANSVGVPLYYGANYGSGECSGGVAADEADKPELIHSGHNKYLIQTYDSMLGPRNMRCQVDMI